MNLSLAETPLIQATSITRFVNGVTRPLLSDVSLDLQRGSRVGLSGPSGAGKTLLLRALALLDPIDHGQILFCGEPVAATDVPSYRKRVIYLHQRGVAFSGSVRDNLQLPFSLREHRDADWNENAVASLLKTAGKDEAFLDKSATKLSGGETQIMALVRAIQLAPDVLLLDEPTAAMDNATAASAEALVNHWHNPERGLIWVSHSMAQTRRMTDTVFAMQAGRRIDAP